MESTVLIICEAFLLAATLSLDAFAASLSYGAAKIKIPYKSMLIIDLICSASLAATFFLGNIIRPYISADFVKYLAFSLLLLIGLTKLFAELIKLIFKKNSNKNINFKMLNFKFILNICQDETAADADHNKILSTVEAVSLSVALSIDSLAVGFSTGLSNINPFFLIGFSLITGFLSVFSGVKFGNKIAKKTKINLSWLSGLILITLAVIRLI